MKPEATKKKPRASFAHVFVSHAWGYRAHLYDPIDECYIEQHPDALRLDAFVDDAIERGIPNPLKSFETLVALVKKSEQYGCWPNVMNALCDYGVWQIYEANLSEKELTHIHLKYGDFIEMIRVEDEE